MSLCEVVEKDSVIAELVELGSRKGLEIILMPFESNLRGLLCGEVIAIRKGLSIQDMRYTLAHEMAHAYLHSDKGNTIFSEKHSEYEEQADRVAMMLLDLLEKKKAIN